MFDEFVGGPLTNCFFRYGPTGADPLNNRAFPDAGAIYWAAAFVRSPGSKVEIEGFYPYSRFMSFISYDKAGLFVDGTADYMIDPDPGSVNTFRNGVQRHATPDDKRRYTIEVRPAEKPADLPLVQNAGQPARYPADWRASYDPAYNRDQFAINPIDYSDPSVPTPPKFGGSYYPNVFNTYLRTFINGEIGKVVVIRLKPWKTVKTFDRVAVFDSKGVDMRFWSISLSESQATTRVVDGVVDEKFPVNADGYVTFVASSLKDHPRFATPECGVAWANWSLRGDGVGNPSFGWLSIRNMLPEPGAQDNFFAFKRPGDERKVLGEHYAELKYYRDAAEFDALGCGGAATKAAMRDIPAKGAPGSVGWPYTPK